MRSIPVNLAAFAGFTCVMPPEAKVLNQDTGEVRKDRASDQTVYEVGIVAMRGRNSSVIRVAVVGEPKGLTVGGSVRVADLEAVPWDRDGRSGISWRAGAIVPLEPQPDPGPERRSATGNPFGTSPAGPLAKPGDAT
jgi:hypothetical protein